MRWSRAAGSQQLAIGTGRGELLLYDRAQRTCWSANAKHKKRITCGDWNSANQFAFASDDRQITICSADGKTFGQVKVKSRPTNVKFGAGGGGGGGAAGGGSGGALGGAEGERHNIVSVSMVAPTHTSRGGKEWRENTKPALLVLTFCCCCFFVLSTGAQDRKTILLYNLDDPEVWDTHAHAHAHMRSRRRRVRCASGMPTGALFHSRRLSSAQLIARYCVPSCVIFGRSALPRPERARARFPAALRTHRLLQMVRLTFHLHGWRACRQCCAVGVPPLTFPVPCVRLVLSPPHVRFRDGYVMVGFSLGFLVVISTHLDEIGREQFCARFHKDSLRDLAYTAAGGRHRVATAGENLVKIVDLKDWKEVLCVEVEPTGGAGARAGGGASAAGASSSAGGGGHGHHGSGPLDKLCWTPDGNYLSVSTRSGCLFVFSVDGGAGAAGGAAAGVGGGLAGQAQAGQALAQRLLHQPFSGMAMLACASAVLASGAFGLAAAAGVSVADAARLFSEAWSV